MNKGITKISLLLWVIAIGGFISSTMHYHSESLHCLEHGHEAHYTENDNTCPVCVIQHVQPNLSSTFTEAPAVQEDTILSFYNFLFQTHPTSFKPERAPPSLA